MSRGAAFSFAPFTELTEAMAAEGVSRFAEIRDRFLAAMGAFDHLQAAGRLTSGRYQHKGYFFNEVIARLIEQCAGLGLARRGKRPGVLLASVDVDICYPAAPGTRPEVIAETKMLGTPKHPGSPREKLQGRPGSRDLDKRIREIALNVIDLKLADEVSGTAPIGDIATWIQQTRPPFFGFFGLRVTDERDRAAIVERMQLLANSYANGVGVVLYEPVDLLTEAGRVTYRPVASPGGMEIDDAVRRICRQIKNAPAPEAARPALARQVPPVPRGDWPGRDRPGPDQLTLD